MENMNAASDTNIGMHAFAEVCYALLLAYIYPLGYKQGTSMSQGIKFGVLMGLVYSLPVNLHHIASMGSSWEVLCFFVANGILVSVAAGISVAMVYGCKSSAPAASQEKALNHSWTGSDFLASFFYWQNAKFHLSIGCPQLITL